MNLRYCDMDEQQRQNYITANISDRPDRDVPASAKSGNYPIPLTTNGGMSAARPSTGAHCNPGGTNKRQNFSFFDVMKLRCVGYRGKLHMVSERWGTDMSLSGTCDAEILEKTYGGYVEGFWVFQKRGDSFVLMTLEK
jgi:hypothetical protein